MKYYLLVDDDQPKSSWAVFEIVKADPKRKRPAEIPPVMYQFFGPTPDGEMRIKPEYESLCCSKCHRYDSDAVFDVGFKDPVTIRIKGDFAHTQDSVPAISDKFLNVLRKSKTRGYETKPLGTSGWHALRVTERVDSAEGVIEPTKPLCPECGRAKNAVGAFAHVSHLSVPKEPNAIFTTKKSWAKRSRDRELFLTEDIAAALKAGGIKGGWCTRLWTDEEVRTAEEKAKAGAKWKPPGALIYLNGK